MAGYVKYMVTVEHLKGVEKENRKPIYSRVIGMYDNLDSAIDKYIELTALDSHVKPTKADIQEVIDDIRSDESAFDEPNNFYQFVSDEIHDWPAFYVGPGRYIIEKGRLC